MKAYRLQLSVYLVQEDEPNDEIDQMVKYSESIPFPHDGATLSVDETDLDPNEVN